MHDRLRTVESGKGLKLGHPWLSRFSCSREMGLWGNILVYALLPVALTLLALHKLSFPFVYVISTFILLDVFLHGLERRATRVASGLTALAVYLAVRIQDRNLATADFWHFSIVLLGTIVLIVLADRNFREKQTISEALTRAKKETDESLILYDLSLEISTAAGKSAALELAVERSQRLFGDDPVLLNICARNGAEAEFWLADGRQTRPFHYSGANPREMEQRILSLLRRPGETANPVPALVSVPLNSRERVIGNLAVVKEGYPLISTDDYRHLKRLAAAITVGVENALLRAEAKNRAEIEARQVLAQEVHDGVAQHLSCLGLKASLAKEKASQGQPTDGDWEEMGKSLVELQRDLRRFIGDLRLPIAVGAAMLESLKSFLEDFSRRQNLAVDVVTSDGLDLLHLQLNSRIQLIRVLQEALSNVAKHSLARKVRVIIQPAGREICMQVEDDGRGFNSDEARDDLRFGLQIMRERVEMVGGRLSIASESGGGTRLTATFPVEGFVR